MKVGSKELDTKGNFSYKSTSTISKMPMSYKDSGNKISKTKSLVILDKFDYDKDAAPKINKFLKPDINRPYYKDKSGHKRSEYKMGIHDNGKEVLIPTVVNGKQLTPGQAISRYKKTGFHMGKFNTIAESEKAAKNRTAKYNMLEDPIRYKRKF